MKRNRQEGRDSLKVLLPTQPFVVEQCQKIDDGVQMSTVQGEQIPSPADLSAFEKHDAVQNRPAIHKRSIDPLDQSKVEADAENDDAEKCPRQGCNDGS
ncbi:hypothetical protein [Roseomonas sp. KE2513]|uniref:hypothetical protein n=1 Tax=Roseomonas sp. KE2513 TaxID=2479202 RepID=UPI0018DF137E|nr:hypothetical protein [Roseomonas sp. KE2513]